MKIDPGRFWSNVRRSDGCWEWTGSKRGNGYGCLAVGGRQVGAHRVAWETQNGPIPEGLFVLHKCDNPPCVRPDHLFLGTAKDNAMDMARKGRAAGARQTHCPKGHPYTEANVYRKPGAGWRNCKECSRQHKRAVFAELNSSGPKTCQDCGLVVAHWDSLRRHTYRKHRGKGER